MPTKLEFHPLQAYLWNPRQWQGSRKVQKMNLAERGLYRELMDECYLHGSVPATVEGISEMLGEEPEVIVPLWPKVKRCFIPEPDDPNRFFSPFIEEVRAEQDANRKSHAERGKAGASKRWTGNTPSKSLGDGGKADQGKTTDKDSYSHGNNGNSMAGDGEEEGKEEGNKEVPPTPSEKGVQGEGGSSGVPGAETENTPLFPKKPKSRGRNTQVDDDLFIPFGEGVAEATVTIVNSCPTHDTDGRKVALNPQKLASRLDLLLKEHPKCSGAMMVQCWLDYLATKPKATKGPQYFFGNPEDQAKGEGANWKEFMRFVIRRAAKAAAEAQAAAVNPVVPLIPLASTEISE